MAKSSEKGVLLKRFKMITAESKSSIPLCVGLSVLLACYINLAGVYVIQPAYEPSDEDMEDIVDINEENAYIVEENGTYVLYYKGGEVSTQR
jgi:hypothetical protein